MLNLKTLKSFDWRSLQKYTTPQAAEDFNVFLETLPQNTNKMLIIIAGVVWAGVGALGLYTTVQMQSLTELRAELQEIESLKPMVPSLQNVPVGREDVERFVNNVVKVYSGLEIRARGPSIEITAQSTSRFGQFREAIGHVQNGGSGWRVSIEDLCVGRECARKPLVAKLKINKVSVNMPN